MIPITIATHAVCLGKVGDVLKVAVGLVVLAASSPKLHADGSFKSVFDNDLRLDTVARPRTHQVVGAVCVLRTFLQAVAHPDG